MIDDDSFRHCVSDVVRARAECERASELGCVCVRALMCERVHDIPKWNTICFNTAGPARSQLFYLFYLHWS